MYILECADGSYYTGSTKDLELRFAQHQEGEGANHTKKRLPVQLVYFEEFQRIEEAFYREKQVQGWSRKKKEALINGMPEKLQDLAKCLNETSHVGFDSTQQIEKSERSLSEVEGKENGASASLSHLVPELRFPEFEKDGEWVKKRLDKVSDIITGSTPSTKEPKYYSGKHMFVSPADIDDNRIIESTKTTLSELGFSKTRQIRANSVLFVCIGSTIGKVAMNKYECATNQQINSLVTNSENSSDFLYSNLEHNSSKISIMAGKQAVPIINKSLFSSVELTFPPIKEEQQKIASCLSSLDELIATHNEKLKALKDHKKGLMQSLFPQEGQKMPNFRFPEFENDGEWVEKSIGSVAKVSAGGTPTSTNVKYWGGDIPWMNSGELNLKRVYSVANNITELGLKESSTNKIPPFCVLIGLAGQGKTRGTAAINYIELCTNQSIGAIHPNNKAFDSEFLYHKIDSMYKTLRRVSTGQGGRGGLNLSIIREIEISFPTIEEQQKISSCLSSLDELISAQEKNIEELQQHKKGLMQGLFPRLTH